MKLNTQKSIVYYASHPDIWSLLKRFNELLGKLFDLFMLVIFARSFVKRGCLPIVYPTVWIYKCNNKI